MDKQKFDALSNYIDMLLDAICVVDEGGHFLYVSAGAERIFGYTPTEMLGKQMLELVHPDDREKTLLVVGEIMSGTPKVDFENRYIRKDGKIVDILWSARWSEDDKIRVAVARDITNLKLSQARQAALYQISEAAHMEDSLPALSRRIHEIIAELMPAGNFAIGLFDLTLGEVSLPHKQMVSEQVVDIELSTLCAWVCQNGQTMQLPTAGPSGETGWMGVPLYSQSKIVGALMVKTDHPERAYTAEEQELLEFVSTQIASVIERKQMLEKLTQLALYDALTSLPNRQLFHDRLQRSIARAQRNAVPMALLFVDLDKFKQANDQLGHAVGDKLLQEAAKRLLGSVRHSDTVVRYGGDEFVILLDAVTDKETASQIAEKVRLVMMRPFEIDSNQIELAASIGLAVYPEDGESERELLHHADSAMYVAKRQGGNQVRAS